LTVAEAAQVLGISAEAVRGRIRRDTLPVEREGGTVYVLLDHPADDRTTTDQPRTTSDQPGDRTDLLITELQDRVRSLKEANRENRRIIAALTQRIPSIAAPQEPSEAPEPVVDEQQVDPYPILEARRSPQSPGPGGGGCSGDNMPRLAEYRYGCLSYLLSVASG
jgi:hypothetical protein